MYRSVSPMSEVLQNVLLEKIPTKIKMEYLMPKISIT